MFDPAKAAEGDLDLTFGGGDGIASTGVSFGNFVAGDQVVQPDGKIVVGGSSGTAGSRQATLARFNPDGTLDPTFQGGGFFSTDFATTDTRILSVDLTSDGHIVVAGERGSGVGAPVFVARFNPNGVGTDFYNEHLLVAAGYTLGGFVKVVPAAIFGVEKIVVGMWNETNAITVRLLDAVTGQRDGLTWAPDGNRTADFGMRSVIQDLELSPDGSRISVSGHFGNFGIEGYHHGGVARLITTTGAPDPAFAGDGTALYNFSATDDWASSIAIDSQGRTLIAGNLFVGSPRPAIIARVTAAGALDPTFDGDGIAQYFATGATVTNTAAIAVDALDRPVVAVRGDSGAASDDFGALRLSTSGQPDSTFGSGGLASIPACTTGGPRTPSVQPDGKVLLMGACGGQITVARFSVQGAITNLALSVVPGGEELARNLNLDINGIDPARRAGLLQSPEALLALQSSPLRNTPLRNTPLRNTPLRNTPLRNTPLRNTPLRNTPLRNTTLPPVLLSDAPLLREGGWAAVLNDEQKMAGDLSLLGQPPQSVTFLQLPDSAIADITLEDIDLSNTPLRNTSVAATLFGATPLQNLPVPGGASGWCAALAGQPLNCGNGVNVATTTIFDLEAGGDDLSGLFGQPIPIGANTLHPDSPLLDIGLNDLELRETPLGAIVVADAPALAACSAVCTDLTLTELQNVFGDGADVASDATLGSVFAALPSFSLTFGQLLLGLVAPDEMPYESIPLDDLLALGDPDVATYTAEFDVPCGSSAGTVVDVDLPDGFAAQPGSGSLRIGTTDPLPTAAGPVTIEGNIARFDFGPTALCAAGAQHIAVGFSARVPSDKLNVYDADVRASTMSLPVVEAVGADIRFIDPDNWEEVTPSVDADTLYTGYISGAGDVDYFDIAAPPEGSRVEVLLSHLPADYDLVLYGSGAVDATPLRNTPLRNTPLRNTPLRNTPVGDEGLQASVEDGTTQLAPETLQDVPLRNTPLRNTSVQRNLSTEQVATTVLESDAGHDLRIQVSGYNGASSSLPYLLRVRVTPPEGDLPCVTRSLGTAGSPGTLPAVADVSSTAKALFLVNKDRIGDMYGMDGTIDWGSRVFSALETLASRADVGGEVLAIEGNPDVAAAYAAWDAEPCSIEAANGVVTAINAVVDGYRAQLAELRHIVLVGSDEALPLARIPDLTTLSNQRDYRSDAAIGGEDNPISRAFARGYLLTDDPYADFDPSEFLGTKLFLPDAGLGRLIEHPAEIIGSIDRYIGAQGQLDLSSSFTAGYDFLKDGATEVDAALRQRGAAGPQSLINDTWTRQNIIDAWTQSPKAVSVNAHYDHYRALPAIGDSSGDARPELLSTADLAAAGLADNALVFGMGCQGGLNIPDVFATIPGAAAKAADWAQVATQQGALYAGNTGYGYGDTDVSAYSERIYAGFAEGLDGSRTIGQAMALAKHQYIGGLGVAGVYDAKAVQEAVFYGLPMYRLGTGEAASIMPPPETPVPVTPAVETTAFDTAPNPLPQSTGRGTYYQVGDTDPQVTHYRPITPRMEVPIEPIAGKRAHGALLEAITTYDVTNAVDPVYAMPTRDLSGNEPEPSIDLGIFPTSLQNVTRVAGANGLRDSLVLLPGQFFNTSDDGFGPGLGVQRLFRNMDGTVFHSDSDDFEAPTIRTVEAFTLAGSALFSVEVNDFNATRATALYLDDEAPANPDGSFTWKRVELMQSPANDRLWLGFGALATGSTQVSQWMVQVVDGAGNVGVSTNKGRYFNGVQLPESTSSGIAIEVAPAPRLDGTYAPGVVATPVAPAGVALERSIDGGQYEDSSTAASFPHPGVHRIAYRGSDGSFAERVLVVTIEEHLQLNVTVPAEGEVFLVGEQATPEFQCLGVVATCTSSMTTLDTSAGPKTVTFVATSPGGRRVEVVRNYNVRYDYSGFFSPVENPDVFNGMKAGSTAPVKFRLSSAAGVVSDTAVVTSISSKTVDCTSGSAVDTIEGTVVSVASTLTYDPVAQQFHYNWKTSKDWSGSCRMLTLTFDDGTTRYALFKLK